MLSALGLHPAEGRNLEGVYPMKRSTSILDPPNVKSTNQCGNRPRAMPELVGILAVSLLWPWHVLQLYSVDKKGARI